MTLIECFLLSVIKDVIKHSPFDVNYSILDPFWRDWRSSCRENAALLGQFH